MEKIYNVSNTIENGSRMDRVKSRITLTKPFLTMLVLLMVCLFGVNVEMWAGRVTGNASVESGVGEVKAQIEVFGLFSGWKWKKDAPNTSTSSSVVSSVELDNSDTKRCKFVVVSTGTGYSFSGWYDENGNRESQDPNFADETVTAGASRTYTYFARFAPIQYNIAFNANYGAGGTGTGTTATVANVKYDRDTTLTLNGYSKIAYTVSYNANGGSGLAKSSDNSYYSFDKWTQNSNGTGTQYANGTTVSNLSATDKATVTLYAKWGTTASKIILPVAPSVAPVNKTFAGWFVDGDAKETVVGIAGDEYTPTGNVTLKAKWTSVKIPGFTGSNQTVTVGETYNFGFSNTSTATPSSSSSANFYYVISDEVVNTDNTTGSLDGTKVISFSGNTVTALNKGTAKIKFYQKADAGNNIVAGESAEYTITVNKKEPTITWASAPYNYNSTINNFYSSDNKDTEIAAISRNTEVASISGATLTTYNKAGSARIVVSQAENYKWAAKKDSISVTPEKKNKHVEFTINADNNGNIEVTKTANVVWQSTGYYKLGTGDWGTSKPDDNVVIGFEGIPDKLSFTLSCDPVEFAGTHYPNKNDYTFEVFESATNGNWISKWSNNNTSAYSSAENVEIQLSSNTRYIKLRYKGTCWGRYTNVRVTELQYFRRQGENTTLNFATNLKNHAPEVQSFVVEHANAGYQTSVTAPDHYAVSLDNVNFASEVVYSTNATALTGGDIKNEFTVYVKYLANEEGTHNANVVVHNNLRSDINVPVTGTTQGKYTTTLHYIGKAAYPADTTNIAVTDLFEVRDANNNLVAGATITLGTGDPGKAVIVGTPNAVDPICSGLVNIAASYAGDGVTYAAATNTGISMPITFNAVDDEVSFDSGYESMVVGEEIDLTEWVTSCTSGTDITVTSVSTDYIVIEDGKVKAVAKGDGRLRAESAGDCRYNSGRSFHNITVRNPDDPCGSSVLYKSGTIKCGAYGKNSSSPEIIEIPDGGPKDKLTFKVWKYSWYATQGATLEILDNNGNTLENGTFSYNVSSLGTSEPEEQNETIDLANFPGAKKLKIYGSGTIYKYFKDIRISQKAYLTASTSSVTMSTVKACETATGQFTVDYSDVSHIQLSQTNNDFTYEVWDGETKLIGFENGCKSYGTYTVKFFYVPQAKGPYSNTVTISASGLSQTITLNGTANAPDRTIVWDIPTANTISATQSLDLTAYAETSCQSPAGGVYYTASPADAVFIDGNHIVFEKAATVTVTAHTVPHDNYNDALAVDKVWTVGKVGTQMRTLPTITSTITYGDNASVVTYDNESWKAEDVLNHNEVEGYINYVGPAEFTAAGPQNLIFNFTPKNVGTYDVCQFTVPVTVQQKASIATPVAANITYGQRVNESVLTSGDGSTTAGTWTWKDEAANTQVLVAREEPYTGLHVIFTPDNNNYTTLEATVSLKVDEAPTDVFTNAAGDNNWDNPDNWSSGVVPADLEPDIVVEGDLKITEDRTVGKLTIENTGSVSVITGGTLTVKGASDPRTEYGDVHVLNDGAISLGNSADLQVRHFTLDAKLGGQVSELKRDDAASGQVENPNKLGINEAAYFQISFDPKGRISYGWYDFTVPFTVNINGGIARVNSAEDKTMVSGTDFYIMEADEVNRANGGKGWRRLNSGVLQPGKLYTITLDDDVNQNTLRFTWNGNGSLVNEASYTTQYAEGSVSSLRGLNGIGNGMLSHGHLTTNYRKQVFNHGTNAYQIIDEEKTFAVGTAFFIQVGEAGTVSWEAAQATVDRPLFAPNRETKEVEEFKLSLRNEGCEEPADVLFFSASEEATDQYVIGHDLVKIGTPTEAKVAQMWSTKGTSKLCDIEATLLNDKASAPLSLFAPHDAAYVLAVDAAPADAYLYLTYEGNVIWDLTMSPFEIELTKGTTNGYGLLMEAKAPAVTTGIEETEPAGQTMRKVIINNTVYIITPEGKMYDIIGKGVKF